MDRSPDGRRQVRLYQCRARSPQDGKPVMSGTVKSDVVRSVGLVSETQEADLGPTESYGRSRVDLDPEY
jgi:hypothetical protein